MKKRMMRILLVLAIVAVWMVFQRSGGNKPTPYEEDGINMSALRVLVETAYVYKDPPLFDGEGKARYEGTVTCYLQADDLTFTVNELGSFEYIRYDKWEGEGNAQHKPICLKINMVNGEISEAHPPVER